MVLVVLVVYSVQLVSLRVAEVEQLCQVKRMIGGIVNKTREDEREERKRGRERARERERKRKRERERREREIPPVCAFNTSPCVRSKCPRVYRQHAHMKKNMWACCRYTRGHFERTHGDVLNAHTGVFSVPHHNKHRTTPQQTPHHTTTNTAPHTTTTHTTQTTPRERERTEEKKTEDRREQKRRRQKTEENRREEDRRQKTEERR